MSLCTCNSQPVTLYMLLSTCHSWHVYIIHMSIFCHWLTHLLTLMRHRGAFAPKNYGHLISMPLWQFLTYSQNGHDVLSIYGHTMTYMGVQCKNGPNVDHLWKQSYKRLSLLNVIWKTKRMNKISFFVKLAYIFVSVRRRGMRADSKFI